MNEDKLFNWNPNKGIPPYEYGSDYPKYNFIPFEYRVLEEDEAIDIVERDLIDDNLEGELVVLADLWQLHLVQRIEVSLLLNAIYYVNNQGEEEHHFLKILEKSETLLDNNKPLLVYISYPFHKMIELTVFPLITTTYWSKIQDWSDFPTGYIMWQIGKLYSELYKEEHEEVGIMGHGLSDLQLGSLNFFKGNKVEIVVNS